MLTGDKTETSEYSAVYLTSGDIYFGKLAWFPWPRIQDVWYLDRSVNQQTQAQEVNLLPMTSVFWGPSGELRLNPKEIIFTSKLRADSQVVSVIKGQGGAQNQQQQLPPQTISEPEEVVTEE